MGSEPYIIAARECALVAVIGVLCGSSCCCAAPRGYQDGTFITAGITGQAGGAVGAVGVMPGKGSDSSSHRVGGHGNSVHRGTVRHGARLFFERHSP